MLYYITLSRKNINKKRILCNYIFIKNRIGNQEITLKLYLKIIRYLMIIIYKNTAKDHYLDPLYR